MANEKNSFQSIEKTNRDIDEILYAITPEEQKQNERIEELKKKVSSITLEYNKNLNTSDFMEFLTQISLNEKSSSNLLNKDETKRIIDKNIIKDKIQDISNFNSIMQMFTQESGRINNYRDYRLADCYIPQVSRCIDLYRDCILSPDDITKQSLHVVYDNPSASSDEEEKFQKDIKDLKAKFDLDSKARTWIRNGLLLGDVFVGVLDISEEINKIILQENHEASNIMPPTLDNSDSILNEADLFSDYQNLNEELNLMEECLLDEDVKANLSNYENKNLDFDSVKKDITEKLNNNITIIKNKKDRQEFKDLFKTKNEKSKGKNEAVNITGCLIKTFEPEKMVKLELEGICFGYLYIERCDMNGDSSLSLSAGELMASNDVRNYVTTQSSYQTIDYFNVYKGNNEERNNIKDRFLTDLFVKGIGKKLNKEIIESNKQFKDIIYSLLKREYIINKRIRITYYEPDEVFHYSPNNEGNTYGTSKLSKVMLYVRILLANIITETMQKISRGRDKRVIYVETGLEDDIEGVVEGVIKDFKSKDLQSDVLQSMDTVLRQTGAFEDYFIPKFEGDTPLEIETLSGMDVNIDNEMTEYIQKSIVTGMGLPATYVDSTNEVDFSRSLVMQNNPFVREIVSLQEGASTFLTGLVDRAYYLEHKDELEKDTKKEEEKKKSSKAIIEELEAKRLNPLAEASTKKESKKKKDDENENLIILDVDKINVELPIPKFLQLSIISDEISNYQTQIDFVTNTYFSENSSDESNDKKRQEFKKRYTKKCINSIDWNEADVLVEEVLRDIMEEDLQKKAFPDVSNGTNNDGLDGGNDDYGDDF